jgi:membrane protein implicated in regulation of membrane protease activity
MNLENFYLIAFLVGFLLSAVSFLAGAMHVGHFHLHGPFHGHGHAGSRGSSLFNVGTASAFLAWFGGAGYLLERYSGLWTYLGLFVAVMTGLAGSALVFWALSKLSAHDQPLDPADYEMVGVLGRVGSPIRAKGTGEMLYMRDGSRKATPARSEDDSAIPRDVEVIVTRYEKGIAYVRRWEEFS